MSAYLLSFLKEIKKMEKGIEHYGLIKMIAKALMDRN